MKTRKIWTDKGGSAAPALIAALVVVLMFVAYLAFFAGGSNNGPGGDDDDDDWWDDLTGDDGDLGASAVCTMYVKDLSSGQIYTANVSLGEASFTEMMMLSFGSGIRSVELRPLQSSAGGDGDGTIPTTTQPLSKNANYEVWGTVSYKVSGENIQSFDSMTVEFYGKSGTVSSSSTPDHATSASDDLYYSGGASKVTVTKNGLTAGTVYEASSADKAFNRAMAGGSQTPLTGDRVDGSTLTVFMTAKGTDTAGNSVTSSAMASMKFNVPSYLKGTITITIIALNGHYELA